MPSEPDRARTLAFVPHGSPFEVSRAEGCYLYTPDGRRVLDAAGGAIVANIGHGRREVAEVAAKALAEVTYVVPPFATEQRMLLVERLTGSWLPAALTRVTFTSGGAESVETALRLARQHHLAAGRPQKWKVIGLDLSYHGVTLGALAVGNHAPRRKGFEPMLAPFPKAPHPYLLPGDPRSPLEAGVRAALALEQLILKEGPETVAAFIAEPVCGSAGGAAVPPTNYWPLVAETCRRHNVLLIADEVMTGFGRTGLRWGHEHHGVTPDIMVGGKGLSGGYAPMGAVFATDDVVAPLAERGEDLMFYTYSAHPASCAVADKVLEIMEREALVERAARMGEALRERLKSVEEHRNVAEVRGMGLLLGVQLVRDRETMENFPAEARLVQKVTAEGLKRGAFFYPGGSGPAQDVVMLGPPFVINEEDLDVLVEVLQESIDAAVAAAS